MPASQNDIGIFANTITPRVLGFTQVAIAAAPAVTALPAIPAGVDFLLIQPVAAVRFRDDGTNSPTITNGIKIPTDTPFQYQASDFSLIEFIPDTSTAGATVLNVVGYSYATRNEV